MRGKIKFMNELTDNIAENSLPSGSKHKCLSCGNEYEGNFCPNCGQSAKVGRLSVKRILTESLPDIYNLDNKFVRTCVDLFRRPGKMIREYIEGDRVKYAKPVSLLFVLATVYLVVAHICNIETSHPLNTDSTIHINGNDIRLIEEGSILEKIIRFLWDLYWNKAWFCLTKVTLLIIPIKFAFRKIDFAKTLNYAEYFFIMVFLMCQQMIIDTVCIPWNFVFGSHYITQYTNAFVIEDSQAVVAFIFEVWAMAQMFRITFRKCFWINIKARFIYFIFFILTGILVMIILYFCGFFDVFKDLDTNTEIDVPNAINKAFGE